MSPWVAKAERNTRISAYALGAKENTPRERLSQCGFRDPPVRVSSGTAPALDCSGWIQCQYSWRKAVLRRTAGKSGVCTPLGNITASPRRSRSSIGPAVR
ncbi:hypothetical protein V5799_004076 [Amblyomma americanum]|uniref:Uncharacterized protein n=1 Tax=Amblyomma americanum TaxID=6943 RepID=A0AAQ4D754_AMBAM